jgi:glycosyltransferase involved in cell wall biosynthesis
MKSHKMIEKPLVSVCIFSYNYEDYIAKAIESVLCQETNFKFEIIIGDDFSTDKSKSIIEDYAAKYSSIIKFSFNLKNKGGTYNWINTMNACQGKYIALLDGDDYFTDVKKLQIQFDCLEKNKGAVLCFHAVEEIYKDHFEKNTIIRFDKEIYHIEDFLIQGWFIRTSTTFFKNGILPQNPPRWVYDFPYRYDTIMHVFLGMKGHSIYIDRPMSIWLKHPKGMSVELLKDRIKSFQIEINMACKLNDHTGYYYNKIVEKYCSIVYARLFLYLIQNKHFAITIKLFPKLVSKSNWKIIGQSILNKIIK